MVTRSLCALLSSFVPTRFHRVVKVNREEPNRSDKITLQVEQAAVDGHIWRRRATLGLPSCQGGRDDPKSCSYCCRLAGRYFTAESGVRDFMGAWVIERGREKNDVLIHEKNVQIKRPVN